MLSKNIIFEYEKLKYLWNLDYKMFYGILYTDGYIRIIPKQDADDIFLVITENPDYMVCISDEEKVCIVY